jgi:site-specific DNA recombinase
MLPSHASKGKTRYRYYITRGLHDGTATIGMRIPANEIEAAVRERIGAIFDDGFALATTDWLQVSPSDYATLTDRCAEVAGRSRAMVRELLQQVRIHDSRIEIDCSTAGIAKALGVARDDDAPDTLTVVSEVRLTRSGKAMRLIQSNGGSALSAPRTSLVTQLIRARRWWAQIRSGEMDIKTLGRLEGVQDAYITRVMRLAFLSPAVVDAILNGSVRPSVDIALLTAPGAISPDWDEQERAFLPAS